MVYKFRKSRIYTKSDLRTQTLKRERELKTLKRFRELQNKGFLIAKTQRPFETKKKAQEALKIVKKRSPRLAKRAVLKTTPSPKTGKKSYIFVVKK